MRGKTEIKVEGHLDKIRMHWFEGMAFIYDGIYTIIIGDIKDEAHLHGVLNKIRDLNLKLISINLAEENNS
jgi:hypothetical protein